MLAFEAATAWGSGITWFFLNLLIKCYFCAYLFIIFIISIHRKLKRGIIWLGAVNFWRGVVAFEADMARNRGIPCNEFELSNEMLLYCVLIHYFHHLNFNTVEIKKKFYFVRSGKVLENSVGFWSIYGLKQGNPLRIWN